MRVVDSEKSAKSRAVDALKAALHQVSTIKLRSIEFDLPDPDLNIDFQAHVDVWGHCHLLVCKFEDSGHPVHIRAAIRELQESADRLAGNATKVLIAPRVSAQAQALCEESRTGFLDLDGNARLSLGEAFIVKRRLAKSAHNPVASYSQRKHAQFAGAA
jgi:hypothetical protein